MDFTILFFLVFIALGFVASFPRFREVYRTKRAKNGDKYYNAFCYRIPMSREEALDRLSRWNYTDQIKYEFDPCAGIITFKPDLPDGTEPERYKVEIADGRLRVSKIDRLQKGKVWLCYHGANTFQFRQNDFWSAKLGAVPEKYTAGELLT